MNDSKYAQVNDIIDTLLNGHIKIFKDRLLGYYLYGSLIWGDFDLTTSDIDTLCVLSSEITPDELDQLSRLHDELVKENPQWKNRIEVHYAPREGLQKFRTCTFQMGNISPGEPLHIIDAGIEWLDEWYCVQEYAVPLFGMDKTTLIPHIEKSEFIQTICNYARSFRERIKTSQQSCYSQAYIILSLCRALYTLKNEEQISKPAAATWAIEFLPEYSKLIKNALIWRQERDTASRNPFDTYALAENFVNDILDRYFM